MDLRRERMNRMDHAHESSFGGRIADLWGHFGPALLIISIGAAIAVGVYPPPGLLGLTLPLALVVFVLASWIFMRRHDRQLCERCLLAMPLNPAQEAARRKRLFWMAHTGSEPRFLVPYLAVVIGSSFAYGTIGKIPWALIQSTMIYLVLAQATHRRLQPWCPWCSEGGGGSEVPDDAPVLPQDDRQPV
jgi:hypothetical protein